MYLVLLWWYLFFPHRFETYEYLLNDGCTEKEAFERTKEVYFL